MIIYEGEEYLTVKEAAKLLGVKRATLYAYVSRGLIRSYRRGIKRQRLYRRAELEALLRVEPGARAGAAGTRAGHPRGTRGSVGAPEIPLAESWIRD